MPNLQNTSSNVLISEAAMRGLLTNRRIEDEAVTREDLTSLIQGTGYTFIFDDDTPIITGIQAEEGQKPSLALDPVDSPPSRYEAEQFCTCSACSNTVLLSETETFRGRRYCKSCARSVIVTCGRCGTRILTFDSFYTATDGYVCDNCRDNYYYECPRCSRLFYIQDGERTEDHLCPDCSDALIIKPWDYKPKPMFFGKHRRFFGIELEFGDGTYSKGISLAKKISKNKTLYCKSDSSIPEFGFEIVSHPCTLEYHRAKLGWNNVHSMIKEYGFRCDDINNCGIHIHINKNNLTNMDILKFDYFINSNRALFSRIARRSSSQWCKMYDKTTADCRYMNEDRHEAVNKRNKNTIELRIFKSSIKENIFMAYLELTDALVSFVKTINIVDLMDRRKSMYHFNEVCNDKKQYNHLPAYLKEHGININNYNRRR